jgi:hypothetical protein
MMKIPAAARGPNEGMWVYVGIFNLKLNKNRNYGIKKFKCVSILLRTGRRIPLTHIPTPRPRRPPPPPRPRQTTSGRPNEQDQEEPPILNYPDDSAPAESAYLMDITIEILSPRPWGRCCRTRWSC